MNRSLALLLSLAALGACTPDYDPPSLVNKFRVLGMRASPPQISLGADVTLATLAVGEHEGEALCYAWAFCPFAQAKDGNFRCLTPGLQIDLGTGATPTVGVAQLAALANPVTLKVELAKAGIDFGAVQKPTTTDDKCNPPQSGGVSPGLSFGGGEMYVLFQIGERSMYGGQCPTDATQMLATICSDRGKCVAGYKQLALFLADPATCKPFDAAADSCTPTPKDCAAKAVCGCDGKTYADDCARVAAKVSRLANGACPNRNPHVSGLRLDGIDWPEDATPTVSAADTLELTPRWPKEDKEFLGRYADPSLGERFEDLIFSWFSTTGTFTHERTADAVPQTGWQVPALKAGETSRDVTLWSVLRDGRDGTDWTVRHVRIVPRKVAWENGEGQIVDPRTGKVVTRPNALCVQDPQRPGCDAVDAKGKAHPVDPQP
jgi:hypothetical protein